jgi:hypothetical protein
VFHSVLIRNLGGPSENDQLLGRLALDTLKQALKVVMHEADLPSPYVVHPWCYQQ